MIDQQKISLEWLNLSAAKHRNSDKILVEKVIRALLLLEGLVKQNLSFVFKGGTALMLHFNSTKRLSIDIDIILSPDFREFEEILDEIVKKQGFSRWELQERNTDSNIKKEHYKFFFLPHHKTSKNEEYVLLDILYEEIAYQNIISLPIQSNFIPQIEPTIWVTVPSLEDMLGDKLTAFAPYTTGIPYVKKGSSMSMEIIKQLYDIGNLFDVVKKLDIIRFTFYSFSETEIAYRNADNITTETVLEDIFQTALCLSTRGQIGKGIFNELQSGVRRVKGFIFSEIFHIEKAIIAASKAAYLAVLMQKDQQLIERFEDPSAIKDYHIQLPEFNKLNKLKKSNP